MCLDPATCIAHAYKEGIVSTVGKYHLSIPTLFTITTLYLIVSFVFYPVLGKHNSLLPNHNNHYHYYYYTNYYNNYNTTITTTTTSTTTTPLHTSSTTSSTTCCVTYYFPSRDHPAVSRDLTQPITALVTLEVNLSAMFILTT